MSAGDMRRRTYIALPSLMRGGCSSDRAITHAVNVTSSPPTNANTSRKTIQPITWRIIRHGRDCRKNLKATKFIDELPEARPINHERFQVMDGRNDLH